MPTSQSSQAAPASAWRAIVVMGVSGSGKSTLARLLAERLQCAFIEGDTLHDARAIAKMSGGHPLNDEDRWPWLDRIGNALRDGSTAGRVAVAACSALRRAYRDRLRAAVDGPTLFVMLDLPHVELEQRMRRRSGHFMPRSLLPSQLATLEVPAPDEQALILDAQQSPESLCEQVLQHLRMAQRGNAYKE